MADASDRQLCRQALSAGPSRPGAWATKRFGGINRRVEGRAAAPTITICGSLRRRSSTWNISLLLLLLLLLLLRVRGLAGADGAPTTLGQDGRMRMAFAQRRLYGGMAEVAARGSSGGLRSLLNDVPGGLVEAYRDDLGLNHANCIANVYETCKEPCLFIVLYKMLHVEHSPLCSVATGEGVAGQQASNAGDPVSATTSRIRSRAECRRHRRRTVPR